MLQGLRLHMYGTKRAEEHLKELQARKDQIELEMIKAREAIRLEAKAEEESQKVVMTSDNAWTILKRLTDTYPSHYDGAALSSEVNQLEKKYKSALTDEKLIRRRDQIARSCSTGTGIGIVFAPQHLIHVATKLSGRSSTFVEYLVEALCDLHYDLRVVHPDFKSAVLSGLRSDYFTVQYSLNPIENGPFDDLYRKLVAMVIGKKEVRDGHIQNLWSQTVAAWDKCSYFEQCPDCGSLTCFSSSCLSDYECPSDDE